MVDAVALADRATALAAGVGTIPGVSRCGVEKGEVVAHARADSIFDICAVLRDDDRFAFEQLMDLCAVDWPSRTPRFDVVYNLLSVTLNQRVRVVVEVADNEPVASIHAIWPVATWWEREAWDLMGVLFSGQPDLRRILTDYGFKGHPLRRDFPLTGYVQVRYDEDRKQVINERVKLTQDFRNFDLMSPWEALTTLPGDEKVHESRAEGKLGQAASAGPTVATAAGAKP